MRCISQRKSSVTAVRFLTVLCDILICLEALTAWGAEGITTHGLAFFCSGNGAVRVLLFF